MKNKKILNCSAKELIDNYDINKNNNEYKQIMNIFEAVCKELNLTDYERKCKILNDAFENMKNNENLKFNDKITNSFIIIK